jgi:NAD(P)-dependent dehydrogenase (short-subunit alcohol dehydrogenase family)
MDTEFSSKSVLVAGGTGGLGQAVSLAFLEQGANVIVTYRNQKEFDLLKEVAAGNSSLLEGHTVDVTDEAATQQFISQVLSRLGRVDVLVNAVGGYAGGVPLWDLKSEVFDRMLALNLRSGYVLARAVAPVMLKQKHGAIVNVASKAAFDHAAGAAAYVASKAAAVAMIKGTGVRVNSILPSIIDTEANRKAMPDADFSQWPKPGEIARVVLFLCSDDAKLVHGAAVPVYGNS